MTRASPEDCDTTADDDDFFPLTTTLVEKLDEGVLSLPEHCGCRECLIGWRIEGAGFPPEIFPLPTAPSCNALLDPLYGRLGLGLALGSTGDDEILIGNKSWWLELGETTADEGQDFGATRWIDCALFNDGHDAWRICDWFTWRTAGDLIWPEGWQGIRKQLSALLAGPLLLEGIGWALDEILAALRLTLLKFWGTLGTS